MRERPSEAAIQAEMEIADALRAVVTAYKRDNPMRTADQHDTGCTCMRCAIDAADTALSNAGEGQ